MKKIGIAGLIM